MKQTQVLRCTTLAVFGLVAGSAFAQQAAPIEATPVPPAPAEISKPVVPMEEPMPGDHWTYEVRDEITGQITSTRESVITEVTPTGITVRFNKLGTDETGLNIYDRSWNLIENRPWRFSPNDGSGIQSPLAVGKTWPVRTNNINSANGNVWKRSGTSKVVGQETVTTQAGTFDTFKIETAFIGSNVNNQPSKMKSLR
jgi:hypothetical protein